MDNHNNDNGLTPLDKQLEEINEWQKNAANPGYDLGSGKVPLPMRNLIKSTIVANLITIVICSGLILGGIIRILKKT